MRAQTLILVVLILAVAGILLFAGDAKAYPINKPHNTKAADTAKVVKFQPITCRIFTEKRSDCSGDYCTASDPAGYFQILCTVVKAVYKGAKAAAISGATKAITTASALLSIVSRAGMLIHTS